MDRIQNSLGTFTFGFRKLSFRFLPNNLRRRNEAATDFQPLDVQTMWIDS